MRKTFALGAILAAAACSFSESAHSRILGQINGRDDPLIQQIRARNGGEMCGLSTGDGFVRLVSFGSQAVVDINGVPTLLSYRPSGGKGGGRFTGKGVDIVMNFVAEDLAGSQVIGHDADVEIDAGDRSEHLDALWDC